MARQIKFSSFLLRSSIWKHTMADFSDKCLIKIPLSTYSSNTMSHPSILFYIASVYLVGDLFNGWVNHIISASDSAIISPVAYVSRIKLTDSQFTVRRYFALLLMLMRLGFKRDACVEHSAGGALQRKCNIQEMAPSSTLFVSHVNLNLDRKLRIEMGSNGSSTCDFICTCRPLANFATLQASSSLY